jgi:protein TonB
VSAQLLDSQPVVLTQARPVYPLAMRIAGVAGSVVVDFIVDTQGIVQNAFVFSTTRSEFNQPSLTAVNQWTFKAGRRAGRAVNTHMQVPIVYTLDG